MRIFFLLFDSFFGFYRSDKKAKKDTQGADENISLAILK